jgi:uncharacterized cupredoxin-like copper-binding protein
MRHFSLALIFALSTAVAAAMAPIALAHSTKATGTTVTVSAGKPSEFSFTLSKKAVPHGAITFKVTNASASGLAHDFKLCSSPSKSTSAASLANSCAGKGTPMLGKGKSATLSVTVAKPGNYEYLCTVPGHAAGGMKGILKVT